MPIKCFPTSSAFQVHVHFRKCTVRNYVFNDFKMNLFSMDHFWGCSRIRGLKAPPGLKSVTDILQ